MKITRRTLHRMFLIIGHDDLCGFEELFPDGCEPTVENLTLLVANGMHRVVSGIVEVLMTDAQRRRLNSVVIWLGTFESTARNLARRFEVPAEEIVIAHIAAIMEGSVHNQLLYWPMQEEPQETACKHGRHDCQRCGTSNRRDTLHTTRAGQGRIAQLRGE